MTLELPYRRNFEWEDLPIIDYDEIYTTNATMRYFDEENTRRMIDELVVRMAEITRVPRGFIDGTR